MVEKEGGSQEAGEAGEKSGRQFSYPSCSAAQYHARRLAPMPPPHAGGPRRGSVAPAASRGPARGLCQRAGASAGPGLCTQQAGSRVRLPAAPALRVSRPVPLAGALGTAWRPANTARGGGGAWHARVGGAGSLAPQLRAAGMQPAWVCGRRSGVGGGSAVGLGSAFFGPRLGYPQRALRQLPEPRKMLGAVSTTACCRLHHTSVKHTCMPSGAGGGGLEGAPSSSEQASVPEARERERPRLPRKLRLGASWLSNPPGWGLVQPLLHTRAGG